MWPVFWLYSHLIILSFWFEDNRAEANYELDFTPSDLPISSREQALFSAAVVAQLRAPLRALDRRTARQHVIPASASRLSA